MPSPTKRTVDETGLLTPAELRRSIRRLRKTIALEWLRLLSVPVVLTGGSVTTLFLGWAGADNLDRITLGIAVALTVFAAGVWWKSTSRLENLDARKRFIQSDLGGHL